MWLQKFGTAIRTPLAPDYSGIYMGELEREAFRDWELLHPDQCEQLLCFKRMIDDGFGLWTGTLEVLDEFLRFMNSRSPHIKFTMEVT